ncbi:hypothetical protein [Dyella ginsengisoli]|uniref:hypothetical protein n=1 Tax=Dyella ginsengisoli TaxID=363848 RepID=UPI0003697076|nr:hypothetical protein [Dyella ginsengisoli]
MKRPHILRQAIKKAARQAFDAERALAWTPDNPVCRRSHARAMARVERAIYQAQRERFIPMLTVQVLLGIVLDAGALARWRINGKRPAPAEKGYWETVEALDRAIDRAWRRARLTRVFIRAGGVQ